MVLLLGVWAVLPALPGYVCLGMGGAHLDRPCCQPDRDEARGEARGEDWGEDWGARPAFAARCCQPEDRPALELGRVPQPQQPLALPQLTLDSASVLAPPPVLLPSRSASWRCRPPPIGPPPPLRSILRI